MNNGAYEVGNPGAVVFHVWSGGAFPYGGGVITGASVPRRVHEDRRGKQKVRRSWLAVA